MKAVVCTKYGAPEVLQLRDVEWPQPRANEVRIRIYATTVHIADTKIRGLHPGLGPVKDFLLRPIMRLVLGFAGPRRKILGMELAGEIEAVGLRVTRWKKGDQVFAATGMRLGAYAESVCLPEEAVMAVKPTTMSFEEAAALPNGGVTALLLLRSAKVHKGQKVLIYGASGSLGTFAVQLAKSLGAEVTGVCSSANLEMVRSLGADKVIDYTAPDFGNSFEVYDVILDAVGKFPRSSLKGQRNAGVYLNVLTSSGAAKAKAADLVFLKDLVEAGKLRTVVDRRYPLEEIVQAHEYVEKGHKKGNVVVTVQGRA